MRKDRQGLLFPKPKNYHLQFLNGRPAGMYSLKRFCFEYVRANPCCLSYYDYDYYEINKKMVYITFGQAVREKIYLQKKLMELYTSGLNKMRPAWMKQREYYKNLLRDIRDGKRLDQDEE